MSKLRLLLADDHSVLRTGLKMLLSSQPDFEVIGEATTGTEAVALTLKLRPDVVVMDIGLPEMSGLEAIRHIKRELPDMKVLVLTAHANEEYLFQVLQAGGSGYLLKKAADSELIEAIHTIQRGQVFLYPEVAQLLVKDYLQRVREGSATERDRFSLLTEREREVLRLVAEGHTAQAIAEKLILSPKTVEAHRAHIMD
ncbi:MAG: response regulator transcription factor, partial [Chloroflexi bacterium]|nr:response regulator transcription factor [Chloroflexota bacterium]